MGTHAKVSVNCIPDPAGSNLESRTIDMKKDRPAAITEILRTVRLSSLFTNRRTSVATSGIKIISVNILLFL